MRSSAVRALVPPGQWPEGARRGQPGGTIVDCWLEQWSEDPGQVALVDGWEPERTVDGARLLQRTAEIAAVLSERGVVPGTRVLWCARAGLDSVESLLAVLRAGAVLVPVNPASTTAEIEHVVSDAGPTVAIADDPAAFGSLVPTLPVADLVDLADAGSAAASHFLPQTRVSDDALIVFTSGTTGRPKGAVHTHASLRAGVDALQTAWGWQPEDRLLLTLPLFHVHGLVAGLFGTLTAGATVTVFDRFDDNKVLESASDHTMFFGVPTMYHRLEATGQARALSQLRLCVSGSAPLAAELWHRFAANGVEVLERYGMTETLLTLSNPLDGERRPGSVGLPLPGVEAAVDDPDGEGVGELFVRAASLCRGYWGRGRPDEATTDSNGWFATGDLVSVSEDGYVTVRGRRTELIITGGHNVYPAEVEAVFARHPGVREVAVVGVPSAEWGETVEAFVVGDPDLESLDDLATRELASFKRPRQVHIVETLPRNALGKVVRGDLRSR